MKLLLRYAEILLRIHKIIRIIKLMLVNKYLIEHAQTLGYHTDKAVRQKSTTDEVVKGKILTEEVEDSDNSGQTNSTPVCQTTMQANVKHEGEAGQTKEEQVLEEHEVPATCCPKRVVRKVRKTDSENKTEGESGEAKEPEKVLEELDDAPIVNVSTELIVEVILLIKKYNF